MATRLGWIIFLCTLGCTLGCASARPSEPATRAPAAVATVDWYAATPPLAHYHLAILNDDVERMREWLARGFGADARLSPTHYSAIQLAISTHRREIVRLLLDNPVVEARPNPRVKVDLCPATRDHLVVSLYDFIVFEEANALYATTCRDEEYYAGRDRAEDNLGITEGTLEAFTGVALNERSPELFRLETKAIRHALKASRATTGRDAPNDRLLSFIENY